jgi:vitamin K-dependent gamma-carboxylase
VNGKRLNLFAPVDVAILVYYRIAFGVLMMVNIALYFATCQIESRWVGLAYHFTYMGFDWVRPWPGDGMVIHFIALGVLALFIAVGLFYRLSMALFFIGYTHAFLIDSSYNLNHAYLTCLISFLMIFVPANGAFSIDARLRPSLRADTAPAWGLYLLRAQFALVYLYGGIAKLDLDWLQGYPLRHWLRGQAVMGPLVTADWGIRLFSYGGLLFDLLVVPLLLWRRTRPYAFAAAVTFHLMNHFFFTHIAIFPFLAIATTALFFSPDWPRRFARWLRPNRAPSSPAAPAQPEPSPRMRRAVRVFVWTYMAIQVALPLRHWLYPGNASWTEEGNFFAWRMMLSTKSGTCVFRVRDGATGREWEVNPYRKLTFRQAYEMSEHPDRILQFAHQLASELRAQGYDQIEVRADARASLNGRELQALIDPSVDLAKQPRTWRPYTWIVPNTAPRPPKREHRKGVNR